MDINPEIKKYWKDTKNFLSNKKVQNIIFIILFLTTLFIGAYIRLQPVINENLIDSTTGDYTPLALDPYYFLRISETLIETGGELPEIDDMRYQALESGWSNEILPQSTVLIYKAIKIFNSEVTLNFATILNPVIFFILGLIVFALLIFIITKNKWFSLVSSFLLAIIPPYLYRTMAGFSDHESIGMFGFFLALLFFAWGLFYIENKKSNFKGSIILGALAGFSTMFAIASWGGGAKFLFMILPLSFFIIWLTKENKDLLNRLIFYFFWVAGIIISSLFFNYSLSQIVKGYMLSSTGILTFIVLGYILIETIFKKLGIFKKLKLEKKLEKYSELIYFGVLLILGGVVYQIFVGNFFSMIFNLIEKIIYPFGTARVGLTVAENKQPYLNDFIGQIGKVVFYTFLLGAFIVGGKIASGIKKKKLRFLFTGSFAFFIMGILFSRVSQTSIFNGTNIFSKAFFFISFLALAISSIYIYRNSEWKIKTKWIFIAAWMIPMLFAVRSAIRVFFAIVPFIAFMVPLTLHEIDKYVFKRVENKTRNLIYFFLILEAFFIILQLVFGFNKIIMIIPLSGLLIYKFIKYISKSDSLLKVIGFVFMVGILISLIFVSVGYYNSDITQSKGQTPSYNSDWQKAMSWVRDNTEPGSVFLHWWDYGYWVQTGGNRPTVTDGGHFNGFWDHLIGRYVLTTPYPETAKSFAKSHNVSHLLIDPTDIGKYSAYSSIGDDEEASDRASYLATFISNQAEIQETRNGITRLYRGGILLDEDIIYEKEGKKILLPKGIAGVGGVTITKTNNSYSQPTGLYFYQNTQYKIPLRYLYIQEELIDFGSGVNVTVYIYPNIYNSEKGQQFDLEGAAMYLSEKVKDSLIVKLYLMDDPNNEYSEFELAHSEGTYPFFFYYQGFRGPIKIWKINEMPNILDKEEFRRTSGEYGEFDDLQFIK